MKLDGFLNIVSAVTRKPGLFRIGSVGDISIFIQGIVVATKDEEINNWLIKFNEFVNKELDGRLVDFGWVKLIYLYSGSESHSLQLFEQLFNDFVKISSDNV